ncbi:hypothetical protein [Streptomyces sp. NPDC059215]|uniref:hypothetical protein n=1 Tax=Streptomyces sp. NPDC059215 TaxID=3346772 RepID=UPI0036C58719
MPDGSGLIVVGAAVADVTAALTLQAKDRNGWVTLIWADDEALYRGPKANGLHNSGQITDAHPPHGPHQGSSKTGSEAAQRDRTWGLRGRTRVVRVTAAGTERISMAALICTKAGHRPRLIYRIHLDRGPAKNRRKGFIETDYARLLDAAHQQLGGPIVLVWDYLNTHVSRHARPDGRPILADRLPTPPLRS